jgi:hypothetical protein
MPRRPLPLLRKLVSLGCMYTNDTPRITRAEINLIRSELGVCLQEDHTNGAMPGPIEVTVLQADWNLAIVKKLIEGGL